MPVSKIRSALRGFVWLLLLLLSSLLAPLYKSQSTGVFYMRRASLGPVKK